VSEVNNELVTQLAAAAHISRPAIWKYPISLGLIPLPVSLTVIGR
jgi:hypothetical protein